MKKLVPIALFVLLAALFASCALTGCGGSSDNNNSTPTPTPTPATPTRDQLVGTWRTTTLQASGGGTTAICPNNLTNAGGTVIASSGASDTLSLNNDNTFTSTQTAANGAVTHPAGAWSLTGNTLRLLQSSGNAGITETFTVRIGSGGQSFTSNDGSVIRIYAK